MVRSFIRNTVFFAKLAVALFFLYNAIYGMAFPIAVLSTGLDRAPLPRVLTFWQIFIAIGLYYLLKYNKKRKQGMNRRRNTHPVYQYTVGLLR